MSILSLEVLSDVAVYTLNGPHVRNSFGMAEAQFLLDSIRSLKGVKGLILKSHVERVFCAGGNLTQYAALKSKEEGVNINRTIFRSLAGLKMLPVQKVAIVDGDCFGGGIELLSCFDTILTSPKSFFHFWQLKLALSFGWGGYGRLLDRMSEQDLRSCFLNIKSISAYEALSLGLVDAVLPVEMLAEKSLLAAQKIRTPSNTFEKAYSLNKAEEQILFEDLWWRPEHRKNLEKN